MLVSKPLIKIKSFMENKNKKKIVLSGGGTGGSVTPLIFVYQELKNDFDFLFVGTYQGIEKEMISKEGINYKAIISGKWRRYFSFSNFIDLFKIFLAFWQSLFLLIKERPSLVFSAGGFVAVPLSYAAWFLRIPVLIHQQDVLPGLANKLISPLAQKITVTFSKSLKIYKNKSEVIGNIGFKNKCVLSKENILQKYNLINQKTLLVLGGGTGSLFINNLINNSLPLLPLDINIIHVFGKQERDIIEKSDYKNYRKFSFIAHQELMEIMNVCDLVVTRAGLSTLTEISFLSKPSIIIPMPDSHQEENAKEFEIAKGAIVLNEKKITIESFVSNVIKVINDSELRKSISFNSSKVIKNGNQAMITIIRSFLNKV